MGDRSEMSDGKNHDSSTTQGRVRLFLNGREVDENGREITTFLEPALSPEEQQMKEERRRQLQERTRRAMRLSMEYWIKQHLPKGEVGATSDMLMASNVAWLLGEHDRLLAELEVAKKRIEELEAVARMSKK